MLSSFYRRLVCRCLSTALGLSLACYDAVLFIFLLQHFICVGVIKTRKVDLISRKYQIMVISMLKNWSRKYFSHFIIKFVGFMPICYTINFNIVSSCMIFSYLYLESIDLLQISINNITFPFKKIELILFTVL